MAFQNDWLFLFCPKPGGETAKKKLTIEVTQCWKIFDLEDFGKTKGVILLVPGQFFRAWLYDGIKQNIFVQKSWSKCKYNVKVFLV